MLVCKPNQSHCCLTFSSLLCLRHSPQDPQEEFEQFVQYINQLQSDILSRVWVPPGQLHHFVYSLSLTSSQQTDASAISIQAEALESSGKTFARDQWQRSDTDPNAGG